MTIEKELSALIDSAFPEGTELDERAKDICRLVGGFGGAEPLSHGKAGEILGVKYSANTEPYTRERVRQLWAGVKDNSGYTPGIRERLIDFVEENRVELRKVERGIALLDTIAPMSAEAAVEELVRAKLLSSTDFQISALLRVAETLDLPVTVEVVHFKGVDFLLRQTQGFELNSALLKGARPWDAIKLLPPTEVAKRRKKIEERGRRKKDDIAELRNICDALMMVATKAIVRNGACRVSDLVEKIPLSAEVKDNPRAAARVREDHRAFVISLMDTGEACTWLDSEQEWFFWNRACRNRVVTKIQQLFAVVDTELTIPEFTECISKCFREFSRQEVSIPSEVLVAIAELVADCRLVRRKGEVLVVSTAQKMLSETLTPEMEHIANFLRENPMSREHEIREELVDRQGLMSPATLSQRLSFSSFLSRADGPRKFSLAGHKPAAPAIEAGARKGKRSAPKSTNRTGV